MVNASKTDVLTNMSLINDSSYFTEEIPTLTVQYLFIIFGSTAFLGNVTICFVLLRNIRFLKKSAFIGGFALAETVFGLGHAAAGGLRLYYLNENTIHLLVHLLYCMNRMTIFFVLTIQVGSMMMILIGAERLLATLFFDWYYKTWSNTKAWSLTCSVYLFCITSTVLCWVMVYNYPESRKITMHCLSSLVSGNSYSTYQGVLVVGSGIWISGATIYSLISFMKKKSVAQSNMKLKQFIQKQWHITTSMTCLACVDLVLVVIPGSLLSLAIFLPHFGLIGNFASVSVCIKSTMTLFIYLIFNPSFRSNFLKAFGKQN